MELSDLIVTLGKQEKILRDLEVEFPKQGNNYEALKIITLNRINDLAFKINNYGKNFTVFKVTGKCNIPYLGFYLKQNFIIYYSHIGLAEIDFLIKKDIKNLLSYEIEKITTGEILFNSSKS